MSSIIFSRMMFKVVLTSVILAGILPAVMNVRLVKGLNNIGYLSEPLVENLNTGLLYTKIQDAIDAPQTLNGHRIMVYSGTYYENVVVNKSISLMGQSRQTTTIFGNNLTDVVLVNANNVNVTNFTIRRLRSSETLGGIALDHVNGCSISGNNITAENLVAISLGGSSHNSIIGNIFTENGLVVNNSFLNIIIDNTVNGKPITYLENVANQIVAAIGQVILVHSFNITVQNSVLTHTSIGVQVRQSNSCRIVNNDLSNSYEGISVADAWDTRIAGNTVANTALGIVFLTNTHNSVISGNNVSNSLLDGIDLRYSSYNSIFGNNIESNQRYGINLYSSSNNTIHHNNFKNNANQVYSDNSYNVWDQGYPSGGNYLSDYAGVDIMHGPTQDQPGSDGIGDTPYVIDESNRDNYPILVSSLTSTGYNITVVPAADVGLQFHQVTTEGSTIVNKVWIGPALPPGGNWRGTYYDITTTASYTGVISIRVNYDDSGLTPEQESQLQLVQWNSTGARNVGDITGPNGWPDGKTDIRDLALVAKYFGRTVPPAPPICDLTGTLYGIPDGKVDIRDIAFVAKHYGQISQNWVSITTYIDTVNNIIYGQAPHLSIFGIR